jgi:hypothetical protein
LKGNLKHILAIENSPVRLSFTQQRDNSVLLIATDTTRNQSVSIPLQAQDIEKVLLVLGEHPIWSKSRPLILMKISLGNLYSQAQGPSALLAH